MTRSILVLFLVLLPITALAGPRTDAAEEAVKEVVALRETAEFVAADEASKTDETEREKLLSEVKALRAEIAGHVADLEDIENAHAALVRGCVKSPLVAVWDAEIDVIQDKMWGLKMSTVGLYRQAVALRPDPISTPGLIFPVVPRGMDGVSYPNQPLVVHRGECLILPAALQEYGPTFELLLSFDAALKRVQAELDQAS